jgi:hypothetical protein
MVSRWLLWLLWYSDNYFDYYGIQTTLITMVSRWLLWLLGYSDSYFDYYDIQMTTLVTVGFRRLLWLLWDSDSYFDYYGIQMTTLITMVFRQLLWLLWYSDDYFGYCGIQMTTLITMGFRQLLWLLWYSDDYFDYYGIKMTTLITNSFDRSTIHTKTIIYWCSQSESIRYWFIYLLLFFVYYIKTSLYCKFWDQANLFWNLIQWIILTSIEYSKFQLGLWSCLKVVGFMTTSIISAYHHESCEFESCSWRGVLNTTLCDKVCQWLATGQLFLQVCRFPPHI